VHCLGNQLGGVHDGRSILHEDAAEFHDDACHRNPFAASSSAVRMALPAAPRMVLWESTVYLIPIANAGSRRTRPTTAAMP